MQYRELFNKVYLVAKHIVSSFQADQCLMRAAGLTYITALSIVPFLAVAFSILKGMGFHDTMYIRELLLEITAEQEVIVQHIIDYINRTDAGTLGVVGVGVLLVTVFTLLGTIENTLNTIWGVTTPRKFSRKFTDYLSVTLASPLLIVVAFSFSASLENLYIVQTLLDISAVGYIYVGLLSIMPYILVCLAMFVLYKFVPNTKTKVASCLVGGAFAGLSWQLLQNIFINYQIGVSQYNAIYGSFAQLPLFLVWLFLSWVVVLLGAEICVALEQRKYGLFNASLGKFNIKSKERLTVALAALLSRSFISGRGEVSPENLAGELRLPFKPINHILSVMVDLGLVIRTGDMKNQGYVLAVSPESMTLGKLRELFRDYAEESAFRFHPAPEPMESFFRNLEEAGQGEDPTLKDLARKLEGGITYSGAVAGKG